MGGNVLLIQIILLAAVAGIAVLLTRSTAGARHQAIRRLCLLLFVVGAAVSVIFPQVLSRLANAVGVGRGADLLLYSLVIAFLSYISTSHRRMNRMSRQITLLTRELTLAEARGVSGDRGVSEVSEVSEVSGVTAEEGGAPPVLDDRPLNG